MKYKDWRFFEDARSDDYQKHDLMNVIADLANRVQALEDEVRELKKRKGSRS